MIYGKLLVPMHPRFPQKIMFPIMIHSFCLINKESGQLVITLSQPSYRNGIFTRCPIVTLCLLTCFPFKAGKLKQKTISPGRVWNTCVGLVIIYPIKPGYMWHIRDVTSPIHPIKPSLQLLLFASLASSTTTTWHFQTFHEHKFD